VASVQQLDAPAGLGIGVLGGLVGISCCGSPVVLYLLGVASATEAVAVGNRLYGEYAWYFRDVGLLIGGGAVALSLRGATSATCAAPARSGARSRPRRRRAS
jgi:hypothetical protein